MPFDNPPPRRLFSAWEPRIVVRPRWQTALIVIAEGIVALGFLASLAFAGLVAWAVFQ